MSTRTFARTLLATTALAAVAVSANAQTLYSGVSTTQVNMIGANPSATFVTGAAWTTTATPSVIVSGSGDAILNIQSGASLIANSNTLNVITLGGTLSNTSVINAGSILAQGPSATSAISASLATTSNTITNSGTISGSINLLAGNDVVTNNTGGTVTGAVALGAGNNTLTINGGTITGAVSAAGGNDTLTINTGGLLNGNVDLGAGNNTASITGATLNGNLLTAGGNDILSLTNGTVSGTIDLGAGTNVLNISGSNAFTTLGTISNIGTMNISTTAATFNHALTGLTSLAANTGSQAVFNVTTTLTGAIASSGTVQVGAANTLTAATANLDGGLLKIDVASSTQAGRLVLTGGTSVSGTQIHLRMLANTNYIASGTALTVIDGTTAATTSATLANAAQEGVFRYSLIRGGAGSSDLIVNIGRVSASSVVEGEASKNIANAFESLTAAQVTGTLATVQGQINAATSAAGLANILDSLNPSLGGVGAASVGVTNATGGQISNRLASLRQGVATGKEAARQHVWVEGFANTADQDDKDGARGYDSTGGGVTFGADTDTILSGMNVGAAFSYGKGNVESKAANGAETDIDSYVLTGYGSKDLGNDIFVNGQVGVGMNKYEMERVIAGVGTAKASPDGWQATAKAEVGRDFNVQGFKLTPTAGAQYTYLKVDNYTETGVGAAGLTVDPNSLNALDFTLGGRAAYDIAMMDGVLTPALRAAVTTRAGDTSLDATSRFIGGGTSFATPGIDADRTSFNLGTGLTFGTAGGAEFSGDYDAKLTDSATGHAFKVKARLPF
jgi:outer membrane autotransporter protein